jgi:hypothetical protein
MHDKAGVPHVEKLGDSTGRLELAASSSNAAAAQPPRKA